ncbi:MAG: MerR family transcriptional regulator [bacterium]|nr:MerR family transcriptional regulator [bacterium]
MAHIKLTISEAADLLGIPAKTIRHYHEIGVLPEPERGDNGYRLYSGTDLRAIQRIRELQGYGLSLKQVAYVLNADQPEVQLRAFLVQRDHELAETLHRLQRQQARVRAFLDGSGHPGEAEPQPSSVDILYSAIKPLSTGVADVLREVEAHTLAEIDRLPQPERYTEFWMESAALLAKAIAPHEHQFILWLERYLALAAMTHDDRQAQAWLAELKVSPDAPLLIKALDVSETDLLPSHDQTQISRLIALLLYEQASPLQKAFIAALNIGSTR